MGRTDWGPIIIGGGLLVGGAYLFFNWKSVCHHFGEGACNWGQQVSAVADDIFSINSLPAEQRGNTRYSAPGTAIPQGTTTATIGGRKVVETRTSASKPLSQNYLKAAAKNNTVQKGQTQSEWCKRYPFNCPKSNFTDFNSFATVTLNRLSVR